MPNPTKVIIIEDDRDINELIAYNLRKKGFYVEQFFDGISGLQRLKDKASGVVILDIMLPGIDGFNICRQIKDDPRNFRTFVIVISAKCHEQDKLYAHILGAGCYFTKPLNLTSLLSVVREANENLDKEFLVKN